jgi:photosystem II stability/assembly factor-like uncharacterized protein
MKHILLLFIFSQLFISFAYTQQASKNFRDISRRMNAYYDSAGKNTSGYKQWKRWEWYYSTRTGDGGVMVNNDELNRQALQTSSVNRGNAAGFAQANTGAWSPLGPTSVNSQNKGIGRVNRIAFHPTNENTMYVASATGGLWITTDAGANWYSYSEGIPNMSLNDVVVDYTNTNIIYILTGDADGAFGGARGQFMYGKTSIGVLKSYDGGFTWYRTALRWNETDIMNGYQMVMHPSNPNILMVATNNGIYRTTNGGSTWDSTERSRDFYDIKFHPTNPSIVYAAATYLDSIIVMKSNDAGVTFTKTHAIFREENANGNGTFNRSALAVSPANSNYVYLLAGPCTAAGVFQGFYRSTDAGETFTLRTNTPNILGASSIGADAKDQHGYDLCVAVSPSNINQVACGGIKLWTSTNGGTSFSWQDDNVSSLSYYHADIHEMAYHPLNSNKLYMCGDGGVYLSVDNGNNWVSVSGNLGVTQYYKIAANTGVAFGAENIVIGGTQDNGTNKRSSSGSSTFSQILGADGMDCLIDPDNLNTYIASVQEGGFYYSGNAGSSFSQIGDPESVGNYLNTTVEGRWVTPVAEITGANTQFILGYEPVVLATNISSAWVFTELGWSGLSFVKTARGNANRIYVGDNDRLGNNSIHTTTNMGSTWTSLLNESNATPVTDLTFDPTNGSRIWITYGGYNSGKKVRFSNDGGATWTYVNGSLPNVPINCILYDGSSGAAPDALYIGTDIGVFYKDNNLGDWIPFSNNLPVVEITDLEMHPTLGLLRAGTYGRGIWETSRYSSCPSDITLNTSNTAMFKPYYHQASSTITSTAEHHGAGANVFYKAGTEIVLSPDFAASGYGENVFEAVIGPCSGGIPNRPAVNTRQRVRGILMD